MQPHSTDQVVLNIEYPQQQRNSMPKLPDRHPFQLEPSGEKENLQPSSPTTITTARLLPVPKPKSRLVEFSQPLHPKPSSEDLHPSDRELTNGGGLSSDDEDDDDDDFQFREEELNQVRENFRRKKRKVGWRTVADWVAFLLITASLVTSLIAPPWKEKLLWGLSLWKFILMVLVVFSGRLVSGWLVSFLSFLIERNFILREKVLYFVYGLRRSVQNCIWLGLVLLAWYVMFSTEIQDSKVIHHAVLNRVWRLLVAVAISAVIWLVKIILVKVLASSFHVSAFFDRMKESVFHYIILEKLSGPAMDEVRREAVAMDTKDPQSQSGGILKSVARLGRSMTMPVARRLSPTSSGRTGSCSSRIDMEQLKRMSRNKASAYTVKRLMSHVLSSGGLPSISSTVDRTMQEFKETESDMTSEVEAKMLAEKIFKKVAKEKMHIHEGDLLKFLNQDEVDTILPLFRAQETRKIKRSAFRSWVVQAYHERKALAHSLNDTKTAVHQLHKLASAIVIIIIIIMTLLIMEVATSKVLVFITSQLVLVAFIFGNTCKTIFESIIFVFVMHPFDVADRCVIDGVQMTVEEMNILNTVFLRYDNEKIYYPNSLLLTKAISNFNRSPDMSDSIDFSIDVSVSAENFGKMKESIKKYIDGKPKYWQPKHHVVVRKIENVNKMKVTLFMTHTINYQNYIEKLNRRSELVLELKRIFENLGIKYNLLPQHLHLSEVRLITE